MSDEERKKNDPRSKTKSGKTSDQIKEKFEKKTGQKPVPKTTK